MSSWLLVLLIAAGVTLAVYLGLIVVLLLLGRKEHARAWAGFVPDCTVLFARLLRDARVSRGQKLLVVALIAYLSLPFDLIPDFVPVVGQLDGALIVALVLRSVLRHSDRALVREHWPGPPSSLQFVLRLASTA